METQIVWTTAIFRKVISNISEYIHLPRWINGKLFCLKVVSLLSLFFLTLESLYLFQIAFGCWMLFWSTHQLDICHQFLKIISHNSETKSQTFLKGWKEITFIGNMVPVTVFFAFSILEQMYFAILLTSHLTNQSTNQPTNQLTHLPSYQLTDQPKFTQLLTHSMVWCCMSCWWLFIWSKFPSFMEPKPSASCSWRLTIEPSELVQCKPYLHITLVPLLRTSFFLRICFNISSSFTHNSHKWYISVRISIWSADI